MIERHFPRTFTLFEIFVRLIIKVKYYFNCAYFCVYFLILTHEATLSIFHCTSLDGQSTVHRSPCAPDTRWSRDTRQFALSGTFVFLYSPKFCILQFVCYSILLHDCVLCLIYWYHLSHIIRVR